jgi:prevent-host-death family protein
MAAMTATDAKNRFGQMLEMAQAEPVHIQKNGRDVGVVLSPEQYARLAAESSKPKVRPVVEELLQESMKKRASLYAALAK